jgi:hypothetical protein
MSFKKRDISFFPLKTGTFGKKGNDKKLIKTKNSNTLYFKH